jgi:hypothetical protein
MFTEKEDKMKRILLPILVIGILLLSACGSPSTAPTTEAPPATSPTGPPATSEEPEPTSPPTAIPQPTPEPEPIEFTGQGDDVSSEFTLGEGITIITMTHDGESNFAIQLFDDTGGLVDLLVNEIGVFDGSVAIGVIEDNIIGAEPGIHVLDITADGNWTVLIKQPRPTNGETLPLNLTGKGCDVSSFFLLDEGLVTFDMTHDGDSNFAIELFSASGELEELLANEIGSYSGKKAIGVKQGNIIGARPGIHIVSVTADGNWTLSISY